MNHLIYVLMQISSPGYYLTWIFPSGKNCHAVVIPGFKCDSLCIFCKVLAEFLLSKVSVSVPVHFYGISIGLDSGPQKVSVSVSVPGHFTGISISVGRDRDQFQLSVSVSVSI